MPRLTHEEAYNQVAEVWRDASAVQRRRFSEVLADKLAASSPRSTLTAEGVAAALDGVAEAFFTCSELSQIHFRQWCNPSEARQPHELTLVADPEPPPVNWPRLWRRRAEPPGPEGEDFAKRWYGLSEHEPCDPGSRRRTMAPEEIDTLTPGLDDVTVLVMLFQTQIEAEAFALGWDGAYGFVPFLLDEFEVERPRDELPSFLDDPDGASVSKTADGWAACCWAPDPRNLIVFYDNRSRSQSDVLAVIGPNGPVARRPDPGEDEEA